MRRLLFLVLAVTFGSGVVAAQDQQAAPSTTPQANQQATQQVAQQVAPPTSSDQILSRIFTRENEEMATIRKYSPLVETYVQQTKTDSAEGWLPDGDRYFIGRADFGKGLGLTSISERGDHFFRNIAIDVKRRLGFGVNFLPLGFLQMIYVDASGLDANNYKFQYMRREFLGEVRTLVYDVTPQGKNPRGRFAGRIWVEDQGYTIVRFNGTYATGKSIENTFDFDSWRINAGPNLWLPTLIYSEEKVDRFPTGKEQSFRAQTRLWGYNVKRSRQEEELGKVMVESSAPVEDRANQERDLSPLQQKRVWDEDAAKNVMDEFQREGLLAPVGEVDKVLATVTNNLEVTNELQPDPEVTCRVLMTSTIESFTVNHTIVLSRGLIDVLPDEASLAVVIAKELGYILLSRPMDTQWGFYDRLLLVDAKNTFQHFDFGRSVEDNNAAAAKGAELLAKSPYKDQLKTPRMFVAELQNRAKLIPNLISARVGDAALAGMSVTPNSEEKPAAADIVALPLGGRVKFDPWNDELTLLKTQPVRNVAEREKMPFEVTPFMPYLTRVTEQSAAATTTAP